MTLVSCSRTTRAFEFDDNSLAFRWRAQPPVGADPYGGETPHRRVIATDGHLPRRNADLQRDVFASRRPNPTRSCRKALHPKRICKGVVAACRLRQQDGIPTITARPFDSATLGNRSFIAEPRADPLTPW